MGDAPIVVVMRNIEHMWMSYRRFNELQQLYELVQANLQTPFIHMYVLKPSCAPIRLNHECIHMVNALWY